MKKIRLNFVWLSASQSEIGQYALVLGEVNGNRRLPIIIDAFMARAIAMGLEKMQPNRPLTHDLMATILRTLGGELIEVLIDELKESIFYSKLVIRKTDGTIIEIDSRTSDAVALGIRFDAPIFTYETVLQVAGVVMEDQDEEEASEEPADDVPVQNTETSDEEEEAPEKQENMSVPDKIRYLQKLMEKAISDEDYERAARIRDEIKKLEEG